MASVEGRDLPGPGFFMRRAVQYCSKDSSTEQQPKTNNSFQKLLLDRIEVLQELNKEMIAFRGLTEKFLRLIKIWCGMGIFLSIGGSVAIIYTTYNFISKDIKDRRSGARRRGGTSNNRFGSGSANICHRGSGHNGDRSGGSGNNDGDGNKEDDH